MSEIEIEVSKKYIDVNWIRIIIESCEHDFHFEVADEMIELFNKKYNDTEAFVFLRDVRATQWKKVHAIIN